MQNLTPEQRRQLDSLISSCASEMEKIKLMRESMNDTIKAFAEKIDVKPKHITIEHKANYG